MSDIELATAPRPPEVKHNPDTTINEIEFDTSAIVQAVGTEKSKVYYFGDTAVDVRKCTSYYVCIVNRTWTGGHRRKGWNGAMGEKMLGNTALVDLLNINRPQ